MNIGRIMHLVNMSFKTFRAKIAVDILRGRFMSLVKKVAVYVMSCNSKLLIGLKMELLESHILSYKLLMMLYTDNKRLEEDQ